MTSDRERLIEAIRDAAMPPSEIIAAAIADRVEAAGFGNVAEMRADIAILENNCRVGAEREDALTAERDALAAKLAKAENERDGARWLAEQAELRCAAMETRAGVYMRDRDAALARCAEQAKQLTAWGVRECPDCGGSGDQGRAASGKLIACETCGGHEDGLGRGWLRVDHDIIARAEQAEAKLASMHGGGDRLRADLALREEERDAALREALTEARGMVEDWAAYASEYFKEKHDLPGDLAKLDAALASPTPDDGASVIESHLVTVPRIRVDTVECPACRGVGDSPVGVDHHGECIEGECQVCGNMGFLDAPRVAEIWSAHLGTTAQLAQYVTGKMPPRPAGQATEGA